MCFVCDQHRIAKKHQLMARHRHEGGLCHQRFLVWPGGEAVANTAPPRGQAGTVDCITNPTRKRGVFANIYIDLIKPSLARRVGVVASV